MTSNARDSVIYKRLLSYTPWTAFFMSLVGFSLYSIANVSVVQLVAYLVDSLQGGPEDTAGWVMEKLQNWLALSSIDNQQFVPIAIVVIVLIRGIGTFIGNYFIHFAANSMIYTLRVELFDRFLSLPSTYFDNHPFGHLVAKLTYHVTQVTGAATDAVKILFREGLTVLGYLGFLLYLNWRLTLLFLIAAPLIGLLARVAGRRFRRISERIQDSMGDVTQVASEAVQGYREVRTFGGEDYERTRFERVSAFNRNQSMKMVITSAIATPVIQLIVSLILAGLVWLLLDPSIRGIMSTGDVVAFITTGGLLAKPIRQLTDIIAIVQKGIAASADLFDVLDEAAEPDDGSVVLSAVKGSIEFRNVSFSYPTAEGEVLKNISFTAKPGETIALVGPSGGGKSTLASLIPRFYEPTSGEILLDDHPIASMTRKSLRSHMAIVSQTITLFNDTIERNIAYGALAQKPAAEVIQATRDAQAWEFIQEFDQGLATEVGDNGVLLSGGQRQRLAIARALLKDAPVLILDEATSALDTESERAIQKALEQVVKGRTTIVIAHRLSTIEKADRILVLDNGEIKEQGTHQELLKLGERYARFFQATEPETTPPINQAAPIARATPSLHPRQDPGFRLGLWLPKAWYRRDQWLTLLTPISWLFQKLAGRKRHRSETHQLRYKCPLPIIVVGNITAGGTGKTPVVIALAQWLAAEGYKPGVISRGFGGSAKRPTRVTATSDPALVGDEPIMIAKSTGAPTICCRDRVRAAKQLVETTDCDVIISDDGLQHYQLPRDFEIVVIDGLRGFGNARLLPAGPLREKPTRLKEVDCVLINGPDQFKVAPAGAMPIAVEVDHLFDAKTGQKVSVAVLQRQPVHAVAGIGHPQRFFQTLSGLGCSVIEHPWPDHALFGDEDLNFQDELAVVMTEKDYSRCRALDFSAIKAPVYVLVVRLNVPESLKEKISRRLRSIA